ncbi:MAG: hypothetical protein AABY22_27725 [Nanoarchaeota archaeon]
MYILNDRTYTWFSTTRYVEKIYNGDLHYIKLYDIERKLYRKTGPSKITKDMKLWFNNCGLYHRKDGPAIITVGKSTWCFNDFAVIEEKYWNC